MAPQGVPMSDIDTITAPDPPPAIAEAPAYRIPLPSPSIFDGLEPEVRSAIEDELEWFSLPGGRVLFEANDPPDGIYLVLTGSLGVARGTGAHAELVAEIGAGETVGDLALLADRPHPATVIALRDCSLVRLNKNAFDRLMRKHPSLVLPLARRVIRRVERAMASRPPSLTVPKTVALIPLDADVPAAGLADALADALASSGLRVKVLDPSADHQIEDTFYAIEIAHDLVIYRAEPWGSPWTQLCVRRSDRVLLIAGSKASPVECLRRLVTAVAEVPWRRAELVLLQGAGTREPMAAEPWLGRRPEHRLDYGRGRGAGMGRKGVPRAHASRLRRLQSPRRLRLSLGRADQR